MTFNQKFLRFRGKPSLLSMQGDRIQTLFVKNIFFCLSFKCYFEGTIQMLTYLNYFRIPFHIAENILLFLQSFTFLFNWHTNVRKINNFAWFSKINVRGKVIFWRSRKLIKKKTYRISRYLAEELFWDIEFEFGFTNLQFHNIIYIDFWTGFSVFHQREIFSKASHLWIYVVIASL